MKKNRYMASGVCGSIKRDLVFILFEPQKERRECGIEKNIQIMVENIPNSTEDINFLKTEDRERILKAAREK